MADKWDTILIGAGIGGLTAAAYLAEAVARSGQIWVGREAVRIRVERGKVTGVGLKNGTEIDSASVISDTDFKNTFLRLVAREALPPAWLRAVSRARQTGSIIQVCVGVDTGKADLPEIPGGFPGKKRILGGGRDRSGTLGLSGDRGEPLG
jgi:phytoene dehydrogenase-like protein